MIVKAHYPVRLEGRTIPAGQPFNATPAQVAALRTVGAGITVLIDDHPRPAKPTPMPKAKPRPAPKGRPPAKRPPTKKG